MLIPVGVILILYLAWLAVSLSRKRKANKRKREDMTAAMKLVQQADEIFELARLTDKSMTIHRGLPGYCILMVRADFQAGLAERGKSTSGVPEFERIDRALEWWMPRETGMIAFSGNALSSFHKGHLDAPDMDTDLMPVTRDVADVGKLLQLFDLWYEYLELPDSLEKARNRDVPTLSAEVANELPSRLTRAYDINPANKMQHIFEYVEDGDPRTFDDMFYGDFEHDFVMWVDHRESDDDIVNMCERVLKTGELEGAFDDQTPDLIITYRGVEHRIAYPNEFADRDTTMIGLNKLLQPEFELRYCNASDGNDTAAFLPLKRDEWKSLELRFGERLQNYFEPVGPGFSKFG